MNYNDEQYLEVDPDGQNVINLPYAAFHYGIRWKVEAISGQESANGFIVQKVKIIAPPFLSSFPIKEYYEAWEVNNGSIVYPEGASVTKEDDCYNVETCTVFESLKQKGEVRYRAKVYWIDKQSTLYEEVSSWDYNTVPQAGNDLRSSLECHAIDLIMPKFVRRDFVHQFDFTDEDTIRVILLELGKSLYDCPREYERRNFRHLYQDDFYDAGLKDLFESVAKELDMLYSK